MWKASWGLSRWETMPSSKSIFDDTKEVFIAIVWKYFHLFGKKLNYLHLKDFRKYECELYMKQPLTPPQRKIIVGYHNFQIGLAIKVGW
jgi:hypothetical protein